MTQPAKPTQNIHEYLAEFEDIPGTRVYTAARARKGYHINQFAMSLMKDENRQRFKADEKAYLDEWPISDEAKAALLALDPAKPEHAEILKLNRATRYIETKPENYKGLEAAARSAGLL